MGILERVENRVEMQGLEEGRICRVCFKGRSDSLDRLGAECVRDMSVSSWGDGMN